MLSHTGPLSAIQVASLIRRGTPQGTPNHRASNGQTWHQRKQSPLVTLNAVFFPASCVETKMIASARQVASDSSHSTEYASTLPGKSSGRLSSWQIAA